MEIETRRIITGNEADSVQYRYGTGDTGREKDGNKAGDEAAASGSLPELYGDAKRVHL